VRKTCVKVLVLVKSREGSSPYGRGLSMLANEGVCLRPQQFVLKTGFFLGQHKCPFGRFNISPSISPWQNLNAL